MKSGGAMPTPVLKDMISIMAPQDLRFIIENLGAHKVIDLFASMGIILQGSSEDIFDHCAFVTSWDYKRTKLLRDMYAMSSDINRLRGFLMECPPGYTIQELYNKLSGIVKRNRRSATSEEDAFGLVEATIQDEMLNCRYKYKTRRVRSDLSMFRDVFIDTLLFVYDTHLHLRNERPLYCVVIQPNTASDYRIILHSFLEYLKDVTDIIIRIIALKPMKNLPKQCRDFHFSNCASSNVFMTNLLDNTIIEHAQIRDVPSIKMFRWDRSVEVPENLAQQESENIDEDLEYHLKDLEASGVSLHKAKTIIAALDKAKHAVSTLGIVYQSPNYHYYTEIAFKTRDGGVELSVSKITHNISEQREDPVYDSQLYWEILWEYWTEFIKNYVSYIKQQTGYQMYPDETTEEVANEQDKTIEDTISNFELFS